MHSYFALALLAVVGVARAEPTCEDCLTFAGNMQAYLLSAESIAVQMSVFNENICPFLEDPAGCMKGVEAHWGDIAAAMYPVFLEANSVCKQLGACKKVNELVGEATCEDCLGGIAGLIFFISSDATVADVITFLKGDAYCMGEATCSSYIDAFMPAAMPTLGSALASEAEQLCCKVSTSGVCC